MFKKYCVIDRFPCAAYKADSELIKCFLQRNGVIEAPLKSADLILINTCAALNNAEDASISFIRSAKKNKKRTAKIVVMGCLPRANKNKLSNIFNGPFINANNLKKIETFIENPEIKLSDIKYTGYRGRKPVNKLDIYRLRIGWGCVNNCSYCVKKRIFGKSRSRNIPDILEEFKSALRRGYKEFILTANDTGSYGLDINTNLAILIKRMLAIRSKFDLRIGDFYPGMLKNMLPLLLPLFRSKKITQIHLAVQSGSDKILKLMHRNYGIAEYKYYINKLKDVNPGLKVQTDFIVGFPKETREDFEKTIQLIDWLFQCENFASNGWQVFPFSSRPNTVADRMDGHLKQREVDRRFKKAIETCEANRVINAYLAYPAAC
ncbi:MAG: radical SAM protein [Candidatus Omnitrophica bacterium]|nr:radical SAM protein [Candidatus Omnitrophota bacterium]